MQYYIKLQKDYLAPMEKTSSKRGYQSDLSIIFILLFTILITTCFGQNKSNLKQENNNAHTATQESVTNWVDPLFYIDGQLCAWVRKIFQDKDGNLWFGTNHYGVMRYDGDSLVYFSENEGLGGGRINDIIEDREGNLWFGTYEGLSRYDGKTFTNFFLTYEKPYIEVWSITIDNSGVFWLGTSAGVYHYNGDKFTNFLIPKAKVMDTTSILSYDRITSIILDRNGIYWFGTDGFGICKYDPSAKITERSAFTHITKEDGLGDNTVADILEDKQGNVWIGTMNGGLSIYGANPSNSQERSITNLTRKEVISGYEVTGFFEDKSGNIWFAAENHGVYRYTPSVDSIGKTSLPNDKSGFVNFNTKDGPNTNGIICILEDKQGRLWFGGWGGLFRYDGNSFLSVTKDGPWGNH